MLKLHFLHAICHNYDMFRSILIIYRQLLRINKAYIKTQKDYWIHQHYVRRGLQILHNLCVAVDNWFMTCGGEDPAGRYLCNW